VRDREVERRREIGRARDMVNEDVESGGRGGRGRRERVERAKAGGEDIGACKQRLKKKIDSLLVLVKKVYEIPLLTRANISLSHTPSPRICMYNEGQ
jgi:hypothetical protein